MQTASRFTLEPDAPVRRSVWLAYAGLCLLAWVLFGVAGTDWRRGDWSLWSVLYEATWNLGPPMLLGALVYPWALWFAPARRWRGVDDLVARPGRAGLRRRMPCAGLRLATVVLRQRPCRVDAAAEPALAQRGRGLSVRRAVSRFQRRHRRAARAGCGHERRASRSGAGARRNRGHQRQAQSALSCSTP